MNGKNYVQSVDRALRLLKLVGESEHPISLQDLVDKTGLNRTTVWRLIENLEAHNLITKDVLTKGYCVGAAIYNMSTPTQKYLHLIRNAEPTLDMLRDYTDETIILSVPQPTGVLTIQQYNPHHAVRLVDYSNTLSPLHCTSNGKIILSTYSQEQLKIFFDQGLVKYTENTIVSYEEMLESLKEIQTSNIGFNYGELDINENAVSTSIRDHMNNIVAFITIGGPSFRFTKDVMNSLIDSLIDAAKQIEKNLNIK